MDHPEDDKVIQRAAAAVIAGMQVLEADRPLAPGRGIWGRSVFRYGLPRLKESRLSAPAMDVIDLNQLMARIAAHQDRDAFAVLFNHFAPRLKSFLIRRGETPESAEDLAQETMVRLWHRAASFDPARADISTWLFAIARNLKIDTFRRDRRADLHADDFLLEAEDPPQPEELLIGSETSDHVQRAMSALPAEQLDLVKLSFFEGRSHGEIAGLLGIPLGTVKSRLRLAFGRLRDKLGNLR